MNRTLLLTAAATLFSATTLVVGTGCEQERSISSSSSSSSSAGSSASTSSRTGSARGETLQASGAPGIGADRGTGVSTSGQITGNVTTGAHAPATPGSAGAATDVAHASGATGGVTAAAGATGVGPARTSSLAAADAAAPADAEAHADAAAVTAAANQAKDKDEHADHGDAHHAAAVAHVKPSGAAPKDMQVSGTVSFAPAAHGVKVTVDLKGLKPNGKHGFHIHEKGDLSDPKLTSAGPHFNPTKKKHGGPEGEERHGGDLGNLTADDKGNVKTTIMAHGVTLDGEADGIAGRSVIVHAGPDDMKSDPAGNSGDRIAGGVIEKHGAKDEGKSDDKAKEKSADAGAAAEAPAAEAQPAAARESGATAAPAAQDLNK